MFNMDLDWDTRFDVALLASLDADEAPIATPGPGNPVSWYLVIRQVLDALDNPDPAYSVRRLALLNPETMRPEALETFWSDAQPAVDALWRGLAAPETPIRYPDFDMTPDAMFVRALVHRLEDRGDRATLSRLCLAVQRAAGCYREDDLEHVLAATGLAALLFAPASDVLEARTADDDVLAAICDHAIAAAQREVDWPALAASAVRSLEVMPVFWQRLVFRQPVEMRFWPSLRRWVGRMLDVQFHLLAQPVDTVREDWDRLQAHRERRTLPPPLRDDPELREGYATYVSHMVSLHTSYCENLAVVRVLALMAHARRFLDRSGRLPVSLGELAPDLTARVTEDPRSGTPLSVRFAPGQIRFAWCPDGDPENDQDYVRFRPGQWRPGPA